MERVVVTGMGVVSPVGNAVADFWQALKSGTSGVGSITRFDASEHTTRYAAEVPDFDPALRIDRREARKMDLFSQYGVYATAEAWEQAGLGLGDDRQVDSERIGVILGVGIGGMETIEAAIRALQSRGPGRVPPMTVPKMIANIGPAQVAIQLQAWGPVYSLATACASSTDAVGQGIAMIRAGLVDVVVTGGLEASITPFGIAGFNVIQALSTKWGDEPTRASRPFDRDRDGFVMGEGAGILVLEREGFAKARGAKALAVVAGSAMTNDANHLTAPHPEGRGAIAAMEKAIRDAGLTPADIDYVNAHGTSTPVNDPTETKAIKGALGPHAQSVAVSSTKSMHGHCIGATGAIEAIACVKAIEDRFVPPTINLENPDEACDLDYVPNVGREMRVRAAMSNSLGFGGHNGVLVFTEA